MEDKKVLVIEDNRDIARLISLHLADLNISVEIAHDGTAGLQKALSENYHLIILDLMLPGTNGMEICRQIRNSNNYTPILMLTAKASEMDRVLGLELGADDYLTKPFSIHELVARVKAIFRRVDALIFKTAVDESDVISIQGFILDARKRHVTFKGRVIDLTAKEFDLLWHFASHPGHVFSRSQLLDTVWGYGHDGYEHTVNSHINRLRRKIESDPANAQYIMTVWGVGYKFSD